MSGRQVLWMMIDSFKVTNTIEGFRSLNHLWQLEWYGDSPHEVEMWIMQVNRLMGFCKPGRFSMEEFRDCIYEKVQKRQTIRKCE